MVVGSAAGASGSGRSDGQHAKEIAKVSCVISRIFGSLEHNVTSV